MIEVFILFTNFSKSKLIRSICLALAAVLIAGCAGIYMTNDVYAYRKKVKVGAPKNLKVSYSRKTRNKVTLKWSKARNANKYKVQVKNGSWKTVKTTKAAKYTFKIKKTSYYRVVAYRGSKKGGRSTSKKVVYKKAKSNDQNEDDNDDVEQVKSTTKYDYKVGFPKNQSGNYYTGMDYPMCIKTNAPSNIDVSIYVKEGYYEETGLEWADFNYISEDTSIGNAEVTGGYIKDISFINPGTNHIVIREYINSKKTGEAVYKIDVKDGEKQEEEWLDSIIAEHTTSDQNPMEKMESIVSYFKNESGFTYYKNYDIDGTGKYKVIFLASECDPLSINKEWDSCVSPSVLEIIANKIGGV